MITREDETIQVTYDGMPLYFWINDEQPGDATGHLVNDVWFAAMTPTVGLGDNDELGAFLVGANGMTLYTFANDEPGVSNCYDQCAVNWPPLTVADTDALSVAPGLAGAFGTAERTDGTLQVTYDGMPLYFWINDEQPGDATGHLVNDVWFVVQPPTAQLGGNEDLGDFLVGANGMTLYTFAKDEPGVSNCYDQCAINWPPLTVVPNEMPTAAEDLMGDFGVITRDDGLLQVTYNDQPLYFWVKDVIPGDATGHMVGDVWFVATP
jgi:predicted lipoprotein with Yx(FWY)xxD motif